MSTRRSVRRSHRRSITFPTVCAHLLGQFLKYFGEDRIVFGSDSPWYGGPQWQIEALWRFEIPDDMRKAVRISEAHARCEAQDPRAQLGATLQDPGIGAHQRAQPGHGNGVYRPFPQDYVEKIPESLKTLLEFPGFTADNFAKARMAYQDWNGAAPRHTRFGWLRNQA